MKKKPHIHTEKYGAKSFDFCYKSQLMITYLFEINIF